VRRIDPDSPSDFEGLEDSFDTVLSLNVLEYREDPGEVLRNLRACLKPGGLLIVLVPQKASLYGSIDRAMGHKRRFDQEEMTKLLWQNGLKVEKIYDFNKIGAPAWWVYSRLARRDYINKFTLKIFDKTVWLWKRVDKILPWRGLSLIAVARKY
jgi:SAM-dependent methyltransferase